METITLRLFEIIQLEAELNGIVDTKNNEVKLKGILNERLSLVTKFRLNELNKQVLSIKNSIDKVKNELIEKYGAKDELGNISINMHIENIDEDGNTKKSINPSYEEFQKEYSILLQEVRNLEYQPLKLDEFIKVESDSYYPNVFKLVSA